MPVYLTPQRQTEYIQAFKIEEMNMPRPLWALLKCAGLSR